MDTMAVEAGQIINRWFGSGTITGLEFQKKIGKYRFFLVQPCTIEKDGISKLHVNHFSVNLPAALNEEMKKYKNGDFVYLEGFLAQSDESRNTKVKGLYIKPFRSFKLDLTPEEVNG